MVMKNNPLNSRFEICIVRGARGDNVGAKLFKVNKAWFEEVLNAGAGF